MAIAKLCGILEPDLVRNSVSFINSCFCYEKSDAGAFGGCPLEEPHAGYTYCGLAALTLLLDLCPEEVSNFDYDAIFKWASNLQDHVLGGFSGRTNKLVDVCYSYWSGSIFQLLEYLTGKKYIFNEDDHCNYILKAAQDPKGGFRDRPDRRVPFIDVRHPDFYHTCYALSGLSLCSFDDLLSLDPRFCLVQEKAVKMISRFSSQHI